MIENFTAGLLQVLAQEAAWDRKDIDDLLSVVRLLEDGYTRCGPFFHCSSSSFVFQICAVNMTLIMPGLHISRAPVTSAEAGSE